MQTTTNAFMKQVCIFTDDTEVLKFSTYQFYWLFYVKWMWKNKMVLKFYASEF